MNNKNLAFGSLNYILLGVGIAIIIIGFFLMSGEGTTEEMFNADIFSDTRIKVAPITCLFGFILIIAAILVKPRNKQAKE